MSGLASLYGKFKVDQVAMVVPDLDRAVERYAVDLGIGPWSIWTFGPQILSLMKLNGQPAEFSLRVAICGQGPMLELIQPLSGATTHREFLDACGPGIHHLATFVKDCQSSRLRLEAAGLECIMEGGGQGLDGSGGFAYFDTRPQLGFFLELLQPPNQRRPPEKVVEPGRAITSVP